MLNQTEYGIRIGKIIISAIFFADDLVLVGKNRKSLKILLNITRKYFHDHQLQLSEKKTKIMTYDASSGTEKLEGTNILPEINIEKVFEF